MLISRAFLLCDSDEILRFPGDWGSVLWRRPFLLPGATLNDVFLRFFDGSSAETQTPIPKFKRS